MKSYDLKNLILSLNQDVVFDFHGKTCCINPWSSKKIELGYMDTAKTYTDIDKLMQDPIFDGKSLNQISSEIVLE